MVKTTSMRGTFVLMNPGDTVSISLQDRKYNTIRNCASILGVEMGRRYSVTLVRQDNSCKVTRVA